jgi:hypothetical protein
MAMFEHWWTALTWSDAVAVCISGLGILGCTWIATDDWRIRRREDRARRRIVAMLARGRCSHGVPLRLVCDRCRRDLVAYLGRPR